MDVVVISVSTNAGMFKYKWWDLWTLSPMFIQLFLCCIPSLNTKSSFSVVLYNGRGGLLLLSSTGSYIFLMVNSSQWVRRRCGCWSNAAGHKIEVRDSAFWIWETWGAQVRGPQSHPLPVWKRSEVCLISHGHSAECALPESERWECFLLIPHTHRELFWACPAIFAHPRPVGQLWRIALPTRGTWHSLPSVAHALSQLQNRSTPTTPPQRPPSRLPHLFTAMAR